MAFLPLICTHIHLSQHISFIYVILHHFKVRANGPFYYIPISSLLHSNIDYDVFTRAEEYVSSTKFFHSSFSEFTVKITQILLQIFRIKSECFTLWYALNVGK